MRRVTPQEAEEFRLLETRLGSLRFRTLITPENKRLMRPERISNLATGRGRISDSEAAQLRRIRRNSVAIENLAKKETKPERKGGKRKPYEVNRKLRDWLEHSKPKDVRADDWKEDDSDWWLALEALDYFDVDVDKGQYYVKE